MVIIVFSISNHLVFSLLWRKKREENVFRISVRLTTSRLCFFWSNHGKKWVVNYLWDQEETHSLKQRFLRLIDQVVSLFDSSYLIQAELDFHYAYRVFTSNHNQSQFLPQKKRLRYQILGSFGNKSLRETYP